MRCIVPNCGNDSSQACLEYLGITYHRFPKQPSLRAAWLQALHMGVFSPDDRSAVCSSHFRREDLMVSSSGVRALRAGAVPAVDVMVCRVCFATDCKLYSMTAHRTLCEAYETLTGSLMENGGGIPSYLCSECTRRLLSCSRFRTTSLRAHSILLDIVKNHGCVTLQLIRSVKGIRSSQTSNQTDYELGIGHTGKEYIYTDGQADITRQLGLRNDIAEDGIRADNDSVIDQDNSEVDDVTYADRETTYSFSENISEEGIKAYIPEDCIKVENYGLFDEDNSKVDDITNADRVSTYSFSGNNSEENIKSYIAEDCIKVESYGLIDQDNSKVDDVTNADRVSTYSFSGNNSEENMKSYIAEDCIKVESYGLIDQDNSKVDDVTNADRESTYSFSQNNSEEGTTAYIAEDCIKVENDGLNDQEMNYNKGEGCSSDDNLPSAETSQGANPSTAGAQVVKVKKDLVQAEVDTRRQPAADDELSCDICAYRTNSERRLLTHLQSHAAAVTYRAHSGKRTFLCDVCNKDFTKKSTFMSHTRTHSGERPFSCDVCNKDFTHKSNLTEHIRIHSGERPFSCDICNKAFIRKNTLTIHMRTHTGERPFSCEVCNNAFICKYNLTVHMKSHLEKKSYSCNICNKEFTQKSNLTMHKRAHSGERPFSCDICNKAFIRKNTLTIHMRTHSGERPFSCDVCNKAFLCKHNVTNHMRTHLEKKPIPV